MSDVSVLIIGGGVMGVSLAYHLAKAGWQDVLLAEKNDLTHGSTWHAAGLCTHFAHNPTVQELRARSVRLYRDKLPEETGQSCGFHPSGAMRITRNPQRIKEFAHVAGLSDFTGYPLELCTPERIAELYPLVKLDGIIGGIYEPDDGHVDPTLATQAMARVASDSGVTILRNSKVEQIAYDGSAWRVTIKDREFRATHIVNAAGTWGWEVGQMMGLEIPSVPVLHQYLVTDAIEAVVERKAAALPELPIIRDPEESWYVRQEGQGLILGPYETDAQVWSVDGVPPEFGAELLPPDIDRVESIIEKAMARIPSLAAGGIKSVVNGPITFTPDANPLIGPARGLSNAWLLTGSSMGIMEGGGAGWFLAHWMTHAAPPMDALAVDSRRFGDWTDRHYRVEKAIECFGLQFGVHYPHEERSVARDIRRSVLHEVMLDAGAVMGVVNGRERPNWFAQTKGDVAALSFFRANWHDAVAAEVKCASERVAIADLSVLSKFEIRGMDVQQMLDALGTNTPPAVGRISMTHALTAAGGCLSEFTVARLNAEQAYLTSAAAAETIDQDLLSQLAEKYKVEVVNVTEQWSVIALMGPRAGAVLSTLCDPQDLEFSWFSVRELEIAGMPVRALRLSYIGEAGWELHVRTEHALLLFQQLMAAGESEGMGCYGAYAANSMRLEKAYRAWGSDLTTERTPIESGLAALVKPQNRHFIGRNALLQRETSHDRWQMVLLDIDNEPGFDSAVSLEDQHHVVDPFYAHTIIWRGKPVGIVTSGAYGHRCGRTLALAYLRNRHARSDLQVQMLGKNYACKILDAAPYDAGNQRMR